MAPSLLVQWVLIFVALFIVCKTLTQTAERFEARSPTIFCSAASFRDAECSATLREIFSKADHPERITVGVCEQNSPDHPEERCLAPQWRKQVKKISIPHTMAKGPTWARYWISTLVDDEDYWLQIDSHTRFEPGWDTSLIEQHAAAVERSIAAGGSRKVVLSTYPKSNDHPAQAQVPMLCKSSWNKNGIPVLDSKYQPPVGGRVPFTSGGMLFAPMAMVREVPYDPALPNAFEGEEIMLSARIYCHGWDVYTPTTNVLSHHYGREEAPKFWAEKSINQAEAAVERAMSEAKIKYLLGLTDKPPAFMGQNKGLGTSRTIQEFWAFSGLDPSMKTSKTAELFCP